MPVVSLRYPCSAFVVPMKIHCLKCGVALRPKDARNTSFCREIKPLKVSISVFFSPASSPISKIQNPCSFSAAVLSFVSDNKSESLNHSPQSFDIIVLLPIPCGPDNTSIVSNLMPGIITRAIAPHKVLRITARVYGLSSAPR